MSPPLFPFVWRLTIVSPSAGFIIAIWPPHHNSNPEPREKDYWASVVNATYGKLSLSPSSSFSKLWSWRGTLWMTTCSFWHCAIVCPDGLVTPRSELDLSRCKSWNKFFIPVEYFLCCHTWLTSKVFHPTVSFCADILCLRKRLLAAWGDEVQALLAVVILWPLTFRLPGIPNLPSIPG